MIGLTIKGLRGSKQYRFKRGKTKTEAENGPNFYGYLKITIPKAKKLCHGASIFNRLTYSNVV